MKEALALGAVVCLLVGCVVETIDVQDLNSEAEALSIGGCAGVVEHPCNDNNPCTDDYWVCRNGWPVCVSEPEDSNSCGTNMACRSGECLTACPFTTEGNLCVSGGMCIDGACYRL